MCKQRHSEKTIKMKMFELICVLKKKSYFLIKTDSFDFTTLIPILNESINCKWIYFLLHANEIDVWKWYQINDIVTQPFNTEKRLHVQMNRTFINIIPSRKKKMMMKKNVFGFVIRIFFSFSVVNVKVLFSIAHEKSISFSFEKSFSFGSFK